MTFRAQRNVAIEQLLFVGTAVHRDNSTALDSHFTKLVVSENSSSAEVTAESVSEFSRLAPFSQLHHLNLAQNKVPYQLNI